MMKIKNLFVCVFSGLIILACGQQTKSNEDFDTFLEKFNTDEEFQRSRVIFPFILEYYDVETNSYKSFEVKSESWEHADFSWNSNDESRQLDAFTREIVNKDDTTEIHFKGVNNGINLRAIFVSKEGKWYYFKLNDNSM